MPHPGVHEELVDVLQTTELAVDQIIALAVARGPADDLHLMKIRAQLFLAFAQEERDFAEILRAARLRAFEDDILHLPAAQSPGALFAQHPADRVRDIAFAAAVRADDGRHTGIEAEDRGISERLEAV